MTEDTDPLDALLALGVTPILSFATGGYVGGLAPWAVAAGAESLTYVPLPADGLVNLELIAAAEPDLIIANWIDEAMYALLTDIAPTVLGKNDCGTPLAGCPAAGRRHHRVPGAR